MGVERANWSGRAGDEARAPGARLRGVVTCALVTLGLFTARSFGFDRAVEITWREPIIVAEDRGVRGEWRQNESNYDYVGDGTVAIDDAGNVAVPWVDQRRKDVLLQVLAPDGSRRFAEPVNISRTWRRDLLRSLARRRREI